MSLPPIAKDESRPSVTTADAERQQLHHMLSLERQQSAHHMLSLDTLGHSNGSPLKKPRPKIGDVVLGTAIGQYIAFLATAFFFIFTGSLAWKAVGGTEEFDTSWDQSIWISWGFFFDPGAHMGLPADEPKKVRAMALVWSFFGFIFNLVFLGVVVDGIRQRMDSWKLDRERFFECDHTVVLGWCDKTLFLLQEMLAEAKTRNEYRLIIIMAEREKTEMMQDVRHFFYGCELEAESNKWIRARRGCAYDVDDLQRVCIGSARDIIVLGSDGLPRECDLEIMRICVALASLVPALPGKVIAEVRCSDVTRVVKKILPNAHGIHARSSANCILCLLGASQVIGKCFLSLCSFASDEELYAVDIPQPLDGSTFGDICQVFSSKAICIGLVVYNWQQWTSAKVHVELAPPDSRKVSSSDRLLLIAPDAICFENDIKRLSKGHLGMRVGMRVVPSRVDASKLPSGAAGDSAMKPVRREPLSIVILGWPNDFQDLMKCLDGYVVKGTVVHMLSTKSLEIRKAAHQGSSLRNIEVKNYECDRTNSRDLAEHAALLADASSILVLAEQEGQTAMEGGVLLNLGDEDTAGDDAITSDSACLMCMIMLNDTLEAEVERRMLAERSPKEKEKASELADGMVKSSVGVLKEKTFEQLQVHRNLICEVLDPRTDALLLNNQGLRDMGTFFKSNMIETGMFSMAATEPVVFNALQMLMSSGAGGDFEAMPCSAYFEKALNGGSIKLSFWDLHDLVRRKGDLLVGWERPYLGAKLSPTNEKDLPLPWTGAEIIVVIKGAASRLKASRSQGRLHEGATSGAPMGEQS